MHARRFLHRLLQQRLAVCIDTSLRRPDRSLLLVEGTEDLNRGKSSVQGSPR
jgi:hypothetical protein